MSTNDKIRVGEDAKESIKQLFNTLLLDDIKRINSQSHDEIKAQINNVKVDITSELKVPIKRIIENIDELKITNSSIIKNIENANTECIDEIEKIINESFNITQTVINSNKESLLSELICISKHVSDRSLSTNEIIESKLSEVKNQLDLKIDGINETLHNYSNDTLDSIGECKKDINIIGDNLRKVSELLKVEAIDIKYAVLTKVEELEAGLVIKNNELNKLYEEKVRTDKYESLKREKKNNILFGIIIVLLVICAGLIIFIKL